MGIDPDLMDKPRRDPNSREPAQLLATILAWPIVGPATVERIGACVTRPA